MIPVFLLLNNTEMNILYLSPERRVSPGYINRREIADHRVYTFFNFTGHYQMDTLPKLLKVVLQTPISRESKFMTFHFMINI